MSINDILDAIKIEMDKAEDAMEGADSDDFLFFGEKLSTLCTLSREIRMILFNKGRTLEEFIQVLRGREDAILEVINLIKKEIHESVKNDSQT